MQRILDPAQIEAFAQRSIARIRLPDPAVLFANRAQRLRALSEAHAVGHSIGGYLRLMAALADAQQGALAKCGERTSAECARRVESGADARAGEPLDSNDGELAQTVAQAREHGMPLIQATSWLRDGIWRGVLKQLCDSVVRLAHFPASVREVCVRLGALEPAELEAQADALLAARGGEIDPASAPFVMAALQVYWVHLVSRLARVAADGGGWLSTYEIDVHGVCPICGTLPVASVVRADKGSHGYRYLHCSLCATEWHMVRITCSHCEETKGLTYHSLEGGPEATATATSDAGRREAESQTGDDREPAGRAQREAIRAESCGNCHSYRKILYQERDMGVDPVADDLASVALDLLLTEEGYHRASGNPLLWQSAS